MKRESTETDRAREVLRDALRRMGALASLGKPLIGCEQRLTRYERLGARIQEAEAERAEIREAIRQSLGDANEGYCGRFRVTDRERTRRSFDLERFADEHEQEDLSPYYMTTTFRRFEVRSVGEE